VNIESSSVERPAIRARRVAALQEVWRDGKWTITMRWFDQEDGFTHAGISASIDRADSTSIEQAADRLVAELLASPGAPFILTGTSGTASYRALRAFQEGSHELSQGRLAEATKSFQDAMSLDRDYGDAHLWFAQSVAWASGRTDEAAASAERAAILLQGDSGRSPEHAAALRDLLLSKYEPACRRFSALSARYPDWAPAHIGLGDCLLRDPTVEADETSPSRWRFRTDWGLAARAYEAALRASGGGRIAEMVYRRVLDALVTEGARIRLGANGLVPTDSFAALPSLRAGKVLFTPYRLSEFRAGAPGTVPVTMSRALVNQRERALTIASSWARLDSSNTEARLALALALEAVGEIGDGTSAFESALAELRWVRRRRQARSDQIRLANAEVRLMLKVGMMAAAGELADSILRDVKGVAPEDARLLAPIAALRADVAKAVTLLEVAWRSPSSYTANDLQQVSPSLRNALARVVVHTSLGLCGGTLDSLTSVSERLAAATVEPARLEQWRQATLSRWWSAQAPCTKGRSVLQVADSSQGIVRLERALVAGDLQEVRTVWSQIVATRQGADASSVAVDIVLTEAWVLMQAGMADEAMRHVENALEALPRAPATVSEELEQFAAVVGLMALRERSRNSATSSRGTVAQGASWDKLVGAAGAALIRRGSWWIRPTGT
jgi:tetratricopeptide (TPR) repeat protein